MQLAIERALPLPRAAKAMRDATKRLVRVATGHRAQLSELLGDDPTTATVPAGFWREVEQDHNREIGLLLAIMFSDTEEHWGGGLLSSQADEWASLQADIAASQYIASSQRKLADLRAKWASLDEAPLPGELRHGLSGIFGPARAETIARTEATRGAAAGAIAVADRLDMLAFWRLGPRERHCPVCLRVADRERAEWGGEFPGGPPIHPMCGCWIEIENRS